MLWIFKCTYVYLQINPDIHNVLNVMSVFPIAEDYNSHDPHPMTLSQGLSLLHLLDY